MSYHSDYSHRIDEDPLFSFPVRSDGHGNYEIVQGLELSDFAKDKIAKTTEELRHEKSVVENLLE